MTRTVLLWVAFGVAGLAFAVGIGLAAADLSSERIGLSSEPLSAGADLAPSAKSTREKPPKPQPAPQPQPTLRAPAPPVVDDQVRGPGTEEEAEHEELEVEPDDDD